MVKLILVRKRDFGRMEIITWSEYENMERAMAGFNANRASFKGGKAIFEENGVDVKEINVD